MSGSKSTLLLAVLVLDLLANVDPRIFSVEPQNKNAAELLLGDPSLPTCPTSNCPAPPLLPVLSTQFIHGATSKDADQAEWLSNIGLLVKSGSPDGQKVAQYIGVMQSKGAGSAWALNTDLVRNADPGGPNAFGGFEGSGRPGTPGAVGVKNASVGYELDFTNWDAESDPGRGPFTVGEYIHAQGSFKSLAAIYLDASMAGSNHSFGWEDGLMFSGSKTVNGNTILDGTDSTSTLAVYGHHKVAVNTTAANDDIVAVALKPGQRICFNSLQACISQKNSSFVFTNDQGLTIFALDQYGNATFAGRVSSEISPSQK